MATKKKKKGPSRRSVKTRPQPRAAKLAPAKAALSTPAVEPSSNSLLFALLFLGIVGLSWLGMRSCSPKPVVPVAPVAPVATAATADTKPVSQAQAPAARSVAPAAAQKVVAPSPKPSARREAAGSADVGAPSLTFDRSQKQSVEVRCWRSANSPAQLDVFAPRNRLVRTLKSEAGAAGWIKLGWDGKDKDGQKVPVGIYFMRPSQEGEQSIRDIWVKG